MDVTNYVCMDICWVTTTVHGFHDRFLPTMVDQGDVHTSWGTIACPDQAEAKIVTVQPYKLYWTVPIARQCRIMLQIEAKKSINFTTIPVWLADCTFLCKLYLNFELLQFACNACELKIVTLSRGQKKRKHQSTPACMDKARLPFYQPIRRRECIRVKSKSNPCTYVSSVFLDDGHRASSVIQPTEQS
jgi:hypothetical protein